MAPTAILDIDGTLVDTNYQHALAWFRAFREHGLVVPVWRVHRHIGMGGDQMVAALAGDEAERDLGDAIRDSESREYAALIDEVQPLDGARDLIALLKRRGHAVVLASSAKEDEVERYVEMLGARDLVDAWTTSADVDATKPEPDLVRSALDKAGAGDGAFMVGDSVWDCEAAARAGVETDAVLTGGFGAQELRDAGARSVHESVRDLLETL